MFDIDKASFKDLLRVYSKSFWFPVILSVNKTMEHDIKYKTIGIYPLKRKWPISESKRLATSIKKSRPLDETNEDDIVILKKILRNDIDSQIENEYFYFFYGQNVIRLISYFCVLVNDMSNTIKNVIVRKI